MSEIISRDQNSRTVGAGVTDDSDMDVSMLRVDPITNYLLVDVPYAGVATGATTSEIASRDENNRTVVMAWDDTNQVLQEVLVDSNGHLLCDITFI